MKLATAFWIPVSCFISSVAVAQQPVDARFWANQGYSLEAEKKYDLALVCFKKAIGLDRNDGDVYFARSGIYSEQKHDYQKAIEDLNEVLRIRPKNYSAQFNRGLYREILKDYDGAIDDYSAVVKPDADFSNFGGTANEARAHALHYRGRVYQWHKADYEQAITDYSASLKLDSSVKRIYFRRALCYQALKNYAAAHHDFEKALESEPEDLNLIDAFAWLLATCPDPSLRDGNRALALAKKLGHGKTLAAAYAENGDFEKAIAELELVILRIAKTSSGEKNDDDLSRVKTYVDRCKQGKPIRD